jgi:hypothetical protein
MDLVQLHSASNSVLHSIVTAAQCANIIKGVSAGAAQVISDYTATMPPIVQGQAHITKYIQLRKRSLKGGGTLPECMFSCLRQEGYVFSTEIAATRGKRLFFFLQNYQLGFLKVDKQRRLARSTSS